MCIQWNVFDLGIGANSFHLMIAVVKRRQILGGVTLILFIVTMARLKHQLGSQSFGSDCDIRNKYFGGIHQL